MLSFDLENIELFVRENRLFAAFALCGLIAIFFLFRFVVRRLFPKQGSSFRYRIDFNKITEVDPIVFELIVAKMFRYEGHSVIHIGSLQADGCLDLLIDKPGVAPVPVQCKRYHLKQINVAFVREFLGGIADGKFNRGIYVTLAGYTRDARELAERNNIELWDRPQIETSLRRNRGKWDDELLYLFSGERPKCPICGSSMTPCKSIKPKFAGKYFWKCRGKCCRGFRPFEAARPSDDD